MEELSVFIDESGDFGDYSYHSPYYIITMVFHRQDVDIQEKINRLDTELSYLGLNNLCIHTGPIIRKEEIYKDMDIVDRRRIFNKMMAFIRSIDVQYKCFHIEKKHIEDSVEATGKLSKLISSFIRNHFDEFLAIDDVYYVHISRMKPLLACKVTDFPPIEQGNFPIFSVLSSVMCTLMPLWGVSELTIMEGSSPKGSSAHGRKMLTICELVFPVSWVGRISLGRKNILPREEKTFSSGGNNLLQAFMLSAAQ